MSSSAGGELPAHQDGGWSGTKWVLPVGWSNERNGWKPYDQITEEAFRGGGGRGGGRGGRGGFDRGRGGPRGGGGGYRGGFDRGRGRPY